MEHSDQLTAPKLRPILGILTLCLGGLSLLRTLFTTISYDIPPPWKEEKPSAPKIEGQKQIGWKGINFKWGGKIVNENAEEKAPVFTVPRILFLVSAALSVLGMMLGPIAYYRERLYTFALPGMSLCFVALLWQYIILGIVFGAAAAIFLIIISIFAQN